MAQAVQGNIAQAERMDEPPMGGVEAGRGDRTDIARQLTEGAQIVQEGFWRGNNANGRCGLWRTIDNLTIPHPLALIDDVDKPSIKIDILPSKPADFTAAKAKDNPQCERVTVFVSAYCGHINRNFRVRPRLGGLLDMCRTLDLPHRARFKICKGGFEHHEHQFGSSRMPVGADLSKYMADLIGCELIHGNGADGGRDIAPNEILVRFDGAGAQIGGAEREPVGEPL